MAESYPPEPTPEEPPPFDATPVGTAPPVPPATAQLQPLSESDERMWAMLAHLSVLLNLFTAILGPVAALVIYLAFKDRSRYVAYQSLQSLIMQLILWVGGGLLAAVAWAITIPLMVVLVGFCLVPIAAAISLAPIAALVYGVYAAVQTNEHKDFQYWKIGEWVRSTYTG